jgi:hypothetical protein
MEEGTVGSTRTFVLAKGFAPVDRHAALIGDDDTRRLFAEVYADPDRPDVRPQEAYQAILSSMQPGWTLRLLQLFWPDPVARLAFQANVEGWKAPDEKGLDILRCGLLLAIEQFPLPFVRRTLLEYVLPGEEGLAWWDGLTGLCAGFGLHVQYLDQSKIEALARWIFNPRLEYDAGAQPPMTSSSG